MCIIPTNVQNPYSLVHCCLDFCLVCSWLVLYLLGSVCMYEPAHHACLRICLCFCGSAGMSPFISPCQLVRSNGLEGEIWPVQISHAPPPCNQHPLQSPPRATARTDSGTNYSVTSTDSRLILRRDTFVSAYTHRGHLRPGHCMLTCCKMEANFFFHSAVW